MKIAILHYAAPPVVGGVEQTIGAGWVMKQDETTRF